MLEYSSKILVYKETTGQVQKEVKYTSHQFPRTISASLIIFCVQLGCNDSNPFIPDT